MGDEQPKLYTELADWWQLVSPTEDYADEAAFFAGLFRANNTGTVLELGCGGGNVAWFLKKDFALTLTDISGAMLAESEKQNPELEHIQGDMRAMRLGRTFDGVLVHDAIMYMTSERDLYGRPCSRPTSTAQARRDGGDRTRLGGRDLQT